MAGVTRVCKNVFNSSLIENLGQMDKTECTHLVVGALGGKKCQYAKKWGVIIVPFQWVQDSIKSGFALSTDLPEYKNLDNLSR